MENLPDLPKNTSLKTPAAVDYGVLNLNLHGVRAVIFDLDGTLIDFKFHSEEARSALIHELRTLGFDVSGLTTAQPTLIILEAAWSQIERGRVQITKEELRSRFNCILDGFDMQAYSQAGLKPYVTATLGEIRERGYLLGLVTNSGAPTVRLTLQKHHLKSFFDAVVTRDDVERMKPSGEGLKRVIQLLKVKTSEAVYVGDSWADVAAAKESGVHVIAVEGGMSTRERLRESSPELILPSLEKLPSLLH